MQLGVSFDVSKAHVRPSLYLSLWIRMSLLATSPAPHLPTAMLPASMPSITMIMDESSETLRKPPINAFL